MPPSRLRPALLTLIILTLLAAGCSPKTAVAQSQVARDKAPSAPPQAMTQLVAGNSAFAFDLYLNLRQQDGNLFFSPYSISSALAMTYAGARGDTEAQMARALHYTLGQEGLHPAFNALDLVLNSAGSGADKGSFTLRSVNSLWAQQDYKFLPPFLDVLGRNYGAGLRLVDYKDSGHREQARLAINDWVKTATADKIPELINQGVLDENTRLVLANAIYFKGDWLAPFDAHSPEAPFTRLDGSMATSHLMFRHAPAAYAAGTDYQAVELPYQGGPAGAAVSLVLLLPPAGQFAAFEQSLTADKVNGIMAALQTADVELFMPRFKYDTRLSLSDALAALGMPLAFDASRADFSGATGQRDLFISKVIHKAFVAVDEKGTEAAAATGVVMGLTSAQPNPQQPVVVKADHPFVFLIRDQQTGSILFVGRVVDPGNS
jgi:serpin B